MRLCLLEYLFQIRNLGIPLVLNKNLLLGLTVPLRLLKHPVCLLQSPRPQCGRVQGQLPPTPCSWIFTYLPAGVIRFVASPSSPSEIVTLSTGYTASASKIRFALVMQSSTHDTRISNHQRIHRISDLESLDLATVKSSLFFLRGCVSTAIAPALNRIITCYESRTWKGVNRSCAGSTERRCLVVNPARAGRMRCRVDDGAGSALHGERLQRNGNMLSVQ